MRFNQGFILNPFANFLGRYGLCESCSARFPLQKEKEVFLFAGFFPFEHQAFFQHMFVQCLAVLN